MYNLKIIIATTRPSRKGPAVAEWILERSKEQSEFNVELLDLAQINLPFLDEPEHPRFKRYQHQHTKDWSKKIDEADAFIIVTAEYNYGIPAPLKNALDFVYQEWNNKPVGIVSYGGLAAGTRCTQMLKLTLGSLKTIPLNESVNIPFFEKKIVDGKFNADDILNKSADIMLTELLKWTKDLKGIRENK